MFNWLKKQIKSLFKGDSPVIQVLCTFCRNLFPLIAQYITIKKTTELACGDKTVMNIMLPIAAICSTPEIIYQASGKLKTVATYSRVFLDTHVTASIIAWTILNPTSTITRIGLSQLCALIYDMFRLKNYGGNSQLEKKFFDCHAATVVFTAHNFHTANTLSLVLKAFTILDERERLFFLAAEITSLAIITGAISIVDKKREQRAPLLETENVKNLYNLKFENIVSQVARFLETFAAGNYIYTYESRRLSIPESVGAATLAAGFFSSRAESERKSELIHPSMLQDFF